MRSRRVSARLACLLAALGSLAAAGGAAAHEPVAGELATVRSMYFEPPAFVPARSGGIRPHWSFREPDPWTHPRGRFTIVWFRLSELGIARFDVQRPVPGRPGRWRTVGSPWTQPNSSWLGAWFFSGRTDAGPLPPGVYRMVARVYDLSVPRPHHGPHHLGPAIARRFRILPTPG